MTNHPSKRCGLAHVTNFYSWCAGVLHLCTGVCVIEGGGKVFAGCVCVCVCVWTANVLSASEGSHSEWWDLLSTRDCRPAGFIRGSGQVRWPRDSWHQGRIPSQWSSTADKVFDALLAFFSRQIIVSFSHSVQWLYYYYYYYYAVFNAPYVCQSMTKSQAQVAWWRTYPVSDVVCLTDVLVTDGALLCWLFTISTVCICKRCKFDAALKYSKCFLQRHWHMLMTRNCCSQSHHSCLPGGGVPLISGVTSRILKWNN